MRTNRVGMRWAALGAALSCAVSLAVVLPGAVGAAPTATAAFPPGAPPGSGPSGDGPSWSVTLVTGDVVRLSGEPGKQSAEVVTQGEPGKQSADVVTKGRLHLPVLPYPGRLRPGHRSPGRLRTRAHALATQGGPAERSGRQPDLLNLLFGVQAAYSGHVSLLARIRQAQKDRPTLEHADTEADATGQRTLTTLDEVRRNTEITVRILQQFQPGQEVPQTAEEVAEGRKSE